MNYTTTAPKDVLIRTALVIAFFSLFTLGAFAQPSDAQIIKDLTTKGVSKVELNKTTTKKEWNSAQAQYMWARGATVWQDAGIAEYPDAKFVIYGYARYHYGASTSFREFKAAETSYEGIPAPRGEEILGMIKERYLKFLGWRAGDMVGDLHYLHIAEEEGVTWHTPNSFTASTEVEFDAKTSYTEVTTIQEKVEVRFYRDAINDPWKEDIVTSSKDRKDMTVKKYAQDEIDAMPTMRQQLEEQAAQGRMNELPKVIIPAFKSDVEVFLYTHKMLREATRPVMEAYLMNMLAPSYFVEGSTTNLNQNGTDLINKALDAAYAKKSTYAQQYCPDPGVKHQQANMMEWWNSTQDKKTRCSVGLFGGGYKNGQKTGEEYKITALEVWLWTDADNIARINSYEPGKLCGASANNAAPANANTSPNAASDKDNNIIGKGKGLIKKITKQ